MSNLSWHEITAAGNLTRETKMIKRDDFNVAYNAIAVNEKKGEDEVVVFYDLVFFGKNADILEEWGQKGSNVIVWGTPTTRTFTDKSGVERPSYGIKVRKFLVNFKDKPSPKRSDDPEPTPSAEKEVTQDAMPF